MNQFIDESFSASMDEFIDTLMEYYTSPDGDIIVTDQVDGAKELQDIVDVLNKKCQLLEDTIRAKNVNVDGTAVKFASYMRGEY